MGEDQRKRELSREIDRPLVNSLRGTQRNERRSMLRFGKVANRQKTQRTRWK
ncbi:hypothetical protein EG68_11708 [Paragonimus skrjabini miyazakii]|uniref:Uncharacterized protein n=1 Tax=Paragonimus skrjabini miyazakii TaxID=59628 RepID=A0A8S9YK98_9TREM|nr:hypothetical protein EG68_11708 [Paragonimus skrjabini miyazakii]